MIHSVIDTVSTENEQELVQALADKMPYAAVKACMQLKDGWREEGNLLTTTGAHFLWWHYQSLGLCDRRKTGKSSHRSKVKYEYRLTSLGVKIRNALVQKGIS